jgi:glycosyltransferase involved in cell wall biosynthesis
VRIRTYASRLPILRKAYSTFLFFLKVLKKQFRGANQLLVIAPKTQQIGSILIVAPGEMALPVAGWGAVELIVERQATFFSQKGYSVTILNSWRILDWVTAWRSKHMFAINHYDVLIKFSLFCSRLKRLPLISTTHYAYAEQLDKWDEGFRSKVRSMVKSDGFVALNPRIQAVFEASKPRALIKCIPNGVEVSEFQLKNPVKDFICLGKVEPRKKQFELAQKLGENFDITFVGEICDPRIGGLNPQLKAKFAGGWSRREVLENLSLFKGLVLISDAEADALVLYEAQSAGLQVFASALALGAQDRNLPWIHEIELSDSNLPGRLTEMLSSTRVSVSEIRTHAEENYTNEISSRAWLEFGLHLANTSVQSA